MRNIYCGSCSRILPTDPLEKRRCRQFLLRTWKFQLWRSLIQVKFLTDPVRPALGSVSCLVRWLSPSSINPKTALFQTISTWHLNRSVPTQLGLLPYTDPVPSTNQYLTILTQYHHAPTTTAQWWPGVTKYQLPLNADPVLPITEQSDPLLTQYHKVPNSTTQYWPSTSVINPPV